jgi:hypothetical protein
LADHHPASARGPRAPRAGRPAQEHRHHSDPGRVGRAHDPDRPPGELQGTGAGRGFWFIVSTILFVAPIFLIVTRLFAAARNASGSAQGPFNTLAYLTVVLWSLYPIVWLLGTEGFGAIGTGSEVFLFLMLDFLAKIAFGILLLTNRQALVEATGGGAAARPSRVR